MKKYIVLFTVLFTFGFFVNISRADCPPGWFQREIIIDNYPDCDSIRVKFCVWCSITSPLIQFQITEITILNPESCRGFYLESFIRFLTERIIGNYFEFCSGPYILCENGWQEITSIIPICWYENPSQRFDFYSCNEAVCIVRYLACKLANGEVQVGPIVSTEVFGERGEDCRNYNEGNRRLGVCFHIETQCQ